MAETQPIQTHSDSARFKTAESRLCPFKHALLLQGSRPPNQGCADSTTASLGIPLRCVNWENFHHGIERIGLNHSAETRASMHHPPHGRDESLFGFCTTQCGIAIPWYNGAMCQLAKLSSRHRAHWAEAFLLYYTILYYAILLDSVLYCILLHYFTVLYCIKLYYMAVMKVYSTFAQRSVVSPFLIRHAFEYY